METMCSVCVACGARETAANDRPICYTRLLLPRPHLNLPPGSRSGSTSDSLFYPEKVSKRRLLYQTLGLYSSKGQYCSAVDGGRLRRRSLPLMVLLLDCNKCNLQADQEQQCSAVMYRVKLNIHCFYVYIVSLFLDGRSSVHFDLLRLFSTKRKE